MDRILYLRDEKISVKWLNLLFTIDIDTLIIIRAYSKSKKTAFRKTGSAISELMLLSVSVYKHELWLNAPNVLGASIDGSPGYSVIIEAYMTPGMSFNTCTRRIV